MLNKIPIIIIIGISCNNNNNAEIENFKLKEQIATLEKEKLEL